MEPNKNDQTSPDQTKGGADPEMISHAISADDADVMPQVSEAVENMISGMAEGDRVALVIGRLPDTGSRILRYFRLGSGNRNQAAANDTATNVAAANGGASDSATVSDGAANKASPPSSSVQDHDGTGDTIGPVGGGDSFDEYVAWCRIHYPEIQEEEDLLLQMYQEWLFTRI